jgi:hypothetical protein
MKKLLLYNLEHEKEKQVLELCSSLHITVIIIKKEDYLESLGTLLKIQGTHRINIPFTGFPFTEEMMIFHDFREKELDNFLEKYNTKKIGRIDLKAQTTPHNIEWNSLKIHDELTYENKIMSQL